MAGFHVELRQDGIAKRFGGDASAVRNKKNSAMRHEELKSPGPSQPAP
jgi:hypothetical protein